MHHRFSDIAKIEAAARILDRISRGLQFLALAGLAVFAAAHVFAAVPL